MLARRIKTALLLMTLILITVLAGCRLSVDGLKNQILALAPTTLPTSTPTPTRQTTWREAEARSATATPLPMTEQELFDVAEALTIQVYEKASPSVVHITSRVITMGFFGPFPSEGTGSGFVIDKQGHIVTNNHVIDRAETIEVTLLDQTIVEAEVVGVDALNDLAVIRVDVHPDKLHPVDMSYSGELKVGQRAIAIGNPFGLDWTLTSGVISSLGRPLRVSSERIIYDVVQTDAAINPGNSGGPLLNSHGQLIGVNTAIRLGAENIGFAVPLSTVRRVVPELIENGRYRHPWLGAVGYSLSPEWSRRLDLPVEEGVLIARIYADSPAYEAGLRGARGEVTVGNQRILTGGDIIVQIDGVAIGSNAALYEFLETRTRVGQEVKVKFYRGTDLMNTQVTLAERTH